MPWSEGLTSHRLRRDLTSLRTAARVAPDTAPILLLTSRCSDVNSRRALAAEAARERERIRAEFGLPVCDVLRDGPDELVDAVIAFKKRGGWQG